MALVDQAAGRRKLRPAELAQIHRFRGYIYLDKGESEKAAEEFQLARDQKALDPAAEQVMIYSLAQIYTQLGQYPRALELIDAWFQAEADPKPDAYYLKAMILAQQEKFAEALEPAKTRGRRCRRRRARAGSRCWSRSTASRRTTPNVAATLQRLVEVAPGNKKYWVQLSAVLNYLQRDPEALATLRLADVADLLSDDPDVRQLARLMFVRELPYQCARAVENALAAGEIKADADAYRLMSNCYLAARENDKALAPLAKAAELSTDAEPYILLGQIHLQQERFDPALDALQKGLAKAKPEQRGLDPPAGGRRAARLRQARRRRARVPRRRGRRQDARGRGELPEVRRAAARPASPGAARRAARRASGRLTRARALVTQSR